MDLVKHKLAAIFATDVVGFSTLMGQNEQKTLENFHASRLIINSKITAYRGRIFSEAGDSIFAEFSSAISAVQCAIECQTAIAERNQRNQVDTMQFRIGINIGECIVDGNNLFGDGVNIAARLESIACPGTICLSKKVYEEVRSKDLKINFVEGALQKLKNINDPIRTYHILFGEDCFNAYHGIRAQDYFDSKNPRINVDLIEAIGGDQKTKALAKALTAQISGGLARNTAVLVKTADADDIDFILRGSIQLSEGQGRFSFALEEIKSKSQIWAGHYDRFLEDVFVLQDEIVMLIGAAIRSRLKTQIFEQLRNISNEKLTVSQLLDKAAGIFHIQNLERSGDAITIINLALNQEPNNAMACSMLAMAKFRFAEYEPKAIDSENINTILQLVEQAVSLNARSYVALTFKAVMLHDFRGDTHAALELASKALEINANFIPAQAMLGIAEAQLGFIETGIHRLVGAIKADPEDASNFRHQRELSIAYWLDGNFNEALRVISKLWENSPEIKRNALVMAAILVSLGRNQDAEKLISKLKTNSPKLSLSNAYLPCIFDLRKREEFSDCLKKVGL